MVGQEALKWGGNRCLHLLFGIAEGTSAGRGQVRRPLSASPAGRTGTRSGGPLPRLVKQALPHKRSGRNEPSPNAKYDPLPRRHIDQSDRWMMKYLQGRFRNPFGSRPDPCVVPPAAIC
ncbi:hypothetical protein AAFF_G00166170 [Aldrovandia affinis]|uniref:Uncharacterized protein n=1 Tax=Aldrovandia affinis TaxID=143900 RepID=A0AAD7RMF7_9TELE|nr:hypothetical protein AAFF_G00166170 [Aldrovandia affinis]